MRCREVTRELSAPTGTLAPGAVAEHLAGCPRCAAWAEQSARLDRIWEATRPSALPDAAWNRIWSNVSDALDHPASLAPARRRRFRPSPALVGSVLAAAALLLGFVTLLRSPAEPQSPPGGSVRLAPVAQSTRPSKPVVVLTAFRQEVEQGQIPLISLDDGTRHDIPPVENPTAVDPFLSMYNVFEAAAPIETVASLQ